MNLIDNLTGFSDQITNLILADGSVATLELVYSPAVERWYFNLTYKGFECTGIGLCCLPNVLRQWKNLLPFGIACVTSDQTDPLYPNDFQTGRVRLYLLNAADVALIELQIFTAP